MPPRGSLPRRLLPRRLLPRRLLHRIPVRVRHYWKLLATCATFLTVCAVLLSTVRVTPLVTSASYRNAGQVTNNVTGTTDLFDATVAHRITLTFHDSAYQRMLDDLWKDGEKSFLEADLTVDGTRLPSVGVRLKGNSTLGSLTRNGQTRPNGLGQRRPQGGQGDAQAPGGFPGGFPGGQGGAQGGSGGQGGGRPAGVFGRASVRAEEPETLPWLIRFDEFVEGRLYQGHREIAVRVGGMGGSTTALNEALSLDVLTKAGQTAQRYAYASLTVNDRPTAVRLVVEHPDDGFAETLGGSGVLYKSLAMSRFTDQGDDPTSYTDDFKQITMKGSQDLQPLINLIRWVTTSSDADFDAHLADHVDVPALARYVAVQNLLLNFDDMAGPGSNYYLWYDLDTKRFTVVGWDYNLTLSGNATQGPHDAITMGGGRLAQGGALPQGFQPPDGAPDGARPPDGAQLPDGMRRPDGNAAGPDGNATGPGGRRGGFGGMGGNKLKERFLASSAFKEIYEDAYRELYRKIYAGATALTALDSITKVLSTIDAYDPEKTTSEVEQLRTLIRQRGEFLATNSVITNR